MQHLLSQEPTAPLNGEVVIDTVPITAEQVNRKGLGNNTEYNTIELTVLHLNVVNVWIHSVPRNTIPYHTMQLLPRYQTTPLYYTTLHYAKLS